MKASTVSQTSRPSRQKLNLTDGATGFWETMFLPRWLPLLLGLVLGPLAAVFAVSGQWPLVVALLLFVPWSTLCLRYPFVAVMLWVLVYPLFHEEGSTVQLMTGWILHRSAIPAALGICVLSSWLGLSKRRQVRFGVAELAMVFFLLIGLLNILVLNDTAPRSLILFYDSVAVPFCMYWLIRLLAPTEKDLVRLALVGLIAVVVQSSVALVSWFDPNTLPEFLTTKAGERTAGTVGSPDTYTIILIFLSMLVLQAAMRCNRHVLRYLMLLAVALAFIGVFFSFSRASWAGAALVLIGLLFIYPRVVLGLSVGLLSLFLVLGNSVLASEMSWAWQRLNTDRTADNRIIVYGASLDLIQARPALGWGYGNHDLYAERFKARVGDVPAQAGAGITSHNAYLTIMAELGLLAFALYMFPAIWWLGLSVKARRRLPKSGYRGKSWLWILWLVLLDQIIISNFNDMFSHSQFAMTLWWMTLGLVATVVWPVLEDRRRGGQSMLVPMQGDDAADRYNGNTA